MTESLDGFETVTEPLPPMTTSTVLDDFEASPAPLGDALGMFEETAKQPERHISHSQISSYDRCSMVNYWRYEKGIKAPPAAAMCFGTSIHKALEHNFGQKMYSRQDLPVSAVTDVFRDSWKEVSREAVFDVEKDENPDSMLDEGVMMVEKYHVEMAPKIQPKAIEMRFTLNLPGIPRTVLGYIDLIDEKEVVSDHKTSRMTPNALQLAKDPQLTLYKMAYRHKFGHNPSGLRYDYMVRKSSKKTGNWVEIHPMVVQRNESHERLLLETYKTNCELIRLKKYVAKPTNFICTPSACGYWSRCMGKILAGEPTPFLDEIRNMQDMAMRQMAEEVMRP